VLHHNRPVAELVPTEDVRDETWEEKKRRLGIIPAKKDPLAIWDQPRLKPKPRKEVFKRTPLTSSALLVTELLRTVRRDFPERGDHAIALLDHIDTMPIDPDVLLLARFVGAPGLRSLDAIHLVTAAMLYPEVSPLITYDRRLAAAAQSLGLRVASPR
jgi:predicted nucleic acid-binding protein